MLMQIRWQMLRVVCGVSEYSLSLAWLFLVMGALGNRYCVKAGKQMKLSLALGLGHCLAQKTFLLSQDSSQQL